MGLLLSFAFRNFSLCGAFKSIRNGVADVNTTHREVVSRLGGIKRPGVMALLCRLTPQRVRDDVNMRHGVLKLFEYPSNTTHVVFSSFGLAEPLPRRFCTAGMPELERNVLQSCCRQGGRNFGRRVAGSYSVCDEVAALRLTEENVKGLHVTGFTFMELPTTMHPIFTAQLNARTMRTSSQEGYIQCLDGTSASVERQSRLLFKFQEIKTFAFPRRHREFILRTNKRQVHLAVLWLQNLPSPPTIIAFYQRAGWVSSEFLLFNSLLAVGLEQTNLQTLNTRRINVNRAVLPHETALGFHQAPNQTEFVRIFHSHSSWTYFDEDFNCLTANSNFRLDFQPTTQIDEFCSRTSIEML
ncbi:hypothetical protein R3P38DRAFT_2786978 [Favolaschia claudopus]|uniref:Alfy-like armadillo-like repeat domain-containing protein n=1 Tax=Favolaschia claudopus TaxID=2862362 RepID=A0AAW0AQ02_9AGAR